jgi:hypothetical protein
VETLPPKSRYWDVAPFIVGAVILGLTGRLLADSRTGLAALASLAGLVLLIAGLGRWSGRARRRAQTAQATQPQQLTNTV